MLHPGRRGLDCQAVFPPGGSVDQVARCIPAVPLQMQLGQSIIVENKGGALAPLVRRRLRQRIWLATFVGVRHHGVNLALISTRSQQKKIWCRWCSSQARQWCWPPTSTTASTKLLPTWWLPAKPKKNVSYGIGLAAPLCGDDAAGQNGIDWTHIPVQGRWVWLMNDAVAGHKAAVDRIRLRDPHIDNKRM
jgi:hypothetical protein